ncbi:uroporphyrinogen-III synthase [Helicobacter acinonychis]|uniref:uroporphyrinogen-III synthase n=1 Tax=Helicobacter acinonychis TaxID=212 RepID=UPI0003230917|nr:uroporphyrinogen-III synthase [Helicobacter acinonychis]
MREIVWVHSQRIAPYKTLILNGLHYYPLELNVNPFNALIFTSKNAVFSLLETLKHSPKLKILQNIPAYALSEPTAKTLQDHHFKIAFIGKKAHGKEFAKEIIPLLKGKSVLYLRAKDIASSLDTILLEHGINLKQAVVYENKLKHLTLSEQNALKPKENSILIFTAISHAKAFLHYFGFLKTHTAISIGNTTAQYLQERGIQSYIAKKPSLEACLDLALSLKVD